MNSDRFWKIIELSRRRFDPDQAEGNMERQSQDLAELLSELPPEEIVSFRDHFEARMRESYDFDLWAAAFLIADGCSDDYFEDFRSWLISMGRPVFEAALANPDSLAGPSQTPGVEDVFFEQLRSIPAEVYEQRTGIEIPEYTEPHLASPTGTKRSDDRDYLQRRFPALWATYGDT